MNANRGSVSDWDVRRLRAGARALLLHRLEVSAEVDFQPLNARPLYRRMTDAYVAWRFSDAARLCIGRQPVRFTLDGATSSNELLALDRNAIAASLWAPLIWGTGASVSGRAGGWQYATGIFSGNSTTREFASFRDGWYFLASAGYDFADRPGVKKAVLRADYVHMSERPGYAGAYPFEQVASLSFQCDTGRAGFSAEAAAGRGRGRTGDVFGVDCMRWWHLSPRFDAVLRFTWLTSNDAGGIRLLRYDNAVSPFRGDSYTEFYGGLNWYLHGHQMKLQTGLSYADLEDLRRGGSYRGWLWVSGLRLSW